MSRRLVLAGVFLAVLALTAAWLPSPPPPTGQTLCTLWTFEVGPPLVTVEVSTPCNGPVSRQCQTEHDRSVQVQQQQFPPVPGTVVHTVKGGGGGG